MPTNENALREQGENKNFYSKTQRNSITNRGLLAYENLRQAWIAEHLDHTEFELIEACISLANACGLKLIKAHQL
jgi:hypothetical protein